MKKNRTMRASILVLALVLITSCFVGGTFAKYVTQGNAGDSARVAKWGVEIFSNAGGSVYATEYAEEVAGSTKGGLSVQATEKVVAPGTSSDEVNNTLVFGVTGTPEVATNIYVVFEGNDVFYDNYHPIDFTLSILDKNEELETSDLTAVDWTEANTFTGTFEEIQEVIANYANFTTEPGEVIDALFKIEWEWAFEQTDADGNSMNAYDTLLGDLAGGSNTDPDNGVLYNTNLSYMVTVVVEQID